MPDSLMTPDPEETARIAAAYHAAAKPKPKLIEVEIVKVEIGKRHRKKVGDLDALAASMTALGLLHPIVITPKPHKLIAGERRMCAAIALGWRTIPAQVVDIDAVVLGEHDENELRRNFTPAERVEIGLEVERIKGNCSGQRTDLQPSKNLNEVEHKRTAQLAAERAGFGNEVTYRQAKTVVEKGAPELVEAMDDGKIAIDAAAQVATLPEAVQQAVAAKPETAPAVAKSVREKSPAAATLKAAKPEQAAKAVEEVATKHREAKAAKPRKPRGGGAGGTIIPHAHSDLTWAVQKLATIVIELPHFLTVLPSSNEEYLEQAETALPKLLMWIDALKGAQRNVG